MKENNSLEINAEELKCILAKHYFWIDFQTNSLSCNSVSLEIEYEYNKEKIFTDREKIKFILKYDKKINSFERPIKKQYIITKDEVIDILNKTLLKEGYKIDNFVSNINTINYKDELNFISLDLRKKGNVKMKKKGRR